VENQGQLILRNVTPGRYDLSREKTLRVGDLGKGFFLDRRLDLTLESGQTVEVAFVREKGQPIFGQVTGLPPDRVPGVFLQVQAAESPGEEPSALGTTTVEALTCPVNGEFKTARISPGDYLLRAEAYEPEPQDGVFRTGLPVPQFIGTAEATVPPDGPAPRVRIEMKPGEEAP
jgi:hypothetical protein